MEISLWIYLLVTLATLVYFYSKRKFSYWKDRNVVHVEPVFFYGNSKPVLRQKIHLSEVIGKLYNKVKSQGKRFGGHYTLFTPQFIPIDLDLIKCILHKDFAHFTNHGFYVNEEKDPLTGHLFNLEDEKWRNLRAKLTPTFTSGKMKMMFQTMVSSSEGLQEMLKNASSSTEPVDIKDVLGCFTTDVIGSVAFGLDINSMKNPDSEFREYGKRIFKSSLLGRIKFIILTIIPQWLFKKIGIKMISKDIESFFINLVKKTVAYREENNVYRKDFMHLLIQLKNIGKISEDNEEQLMQKNKNNLQGLSINEMAAQSFVFFLAGFETSATTMSFALLELAQNEELQNKVRDEINRVLAKHDDKVTYESIMDMEYLEKVVLESLRKHPPLALLPRICTKNYQVPDSDLVITVGTRLNIPVLSIHRDPDYYPDPDKFDPERFNEENKAKRHPFAYLPFGEGPRTCIGLRFGKLQSKVGLCHVLRNYKVTLNEKTQLPIKYEGSLISSVKDGIWLNLEPVS
ncbi:unnamed protein product [Diabrotica balteata]|uniref:Cytochrome P450 n=1 Tax=Diabrotica balteata TaxID=107213 RepID=A0A9N9SP66_DIABA|nr:unnamed protein product [Diabrotica balteata]